MPDLDHLRSQLEQAREELRKIGEQIEAAEQEDTQTPTQRNASTSEKVLRRWGVSLATALLGTLLWTAKRTRDVAIASAGSVATGTAFLSTGVPDLGRIQMMFPPDPPAYTSSAAPSIRDGTPGRVRPRDLQCLL